jgi:hypothetical protein
MRVKRLGMPTSLLGAAVLATIGFLPAGAAARDTHGQNQLIPLYDNGNPADWTEACSQTNGAGDGSWIIADVAEGGEGGGPGSVSVPSWAKVIADCYEYGRASVIGYVWTNYGRGGQASIAAIESQIKAWYSFYPGNIAGIFLDGVSDTVPGTTTSNQSFYRTLASYVHTHEGNNDEVVLNFGANPSSDWMLGGSSTNNADIVVTFEGSYNTAGEGPYTSWTPASWERHYPANDFAALVYNASDSPPATPQPASVCASLAQQNIGYVYVGTWYDQLPSYFGTLMTDSAQGNC